MMDKVTGVGDTVASHYNNLQSCNLKQRTFSRIYFMRNFNNWVKSTLIGKVTSKVSKLNRINVLDLASGKGGDLLKWNKLRNIENIVFTDIAETSVEQSKIRFNKAYNICYKAEFITLDSSKSQLKSHLKDPNMKFDITSCQFALHYAFESYNQARIFMHNACSMLKPGGFFIGTIPNDLEIMRRMEKCAPDGKLKFGNDVYSIEFTCPPTDHTSLFGNEYLFNLEGVVDCPEFLVHFPLLIKLAEELDMELVYQKSFGDFYEETILDPHNIQLLKYTKSLEPYPCSKNSKMSSSDSESYKRAKDSDADVHKVYGTLSIEEWDAITLYQVFIFRKKENP